MELINKYGTMKKYILPLLSIAMMTTMASCSSSDDEVAENNNIDVKLVPMTFTATQETNVGTRAVLDSENKVNWQAADEISLFDGVDNQKFTLTGDVSEGKFSGEASSTATSYTAVYPYTSGARLNSDGSVSGITLHAEQTATLGSFDPKAALMMAVSTESNKNQLDFKNAVSLVKITTEFACKKIVLSADVDIAGTGKLTYYNGEPSITLEENQSKSIMLKPATGETFVAGTYYIVIPAITLSGFSISFINSDDTKVYARTSTKENTFNRSKIKDFGTFGEEDGFPWTSVIESNGIVKASQQVDMGLTISDSEGKTYKVIFAKTNLTKEGLAEKASDFGDYFAWAATEPWCTAYERTTTNGTAEEWYNSKNYKTYAWSTVPYKRVDANICSKYKNDGDVLEADDDAARHILGGDWQLPTIEIWKALYNTTNYIWEWTTQDGYNGRKVTSQTDGTKSLFLPAAGYVVNTSFKDVGSYGFYWSGTARQSTFAYNLNFISGNVDAEKYSYRYKGFTVRPVRLVAVD